MSLKSGPIGHSVQKCLTVAVHRAGDCQWGEYRRRDSRVWWPWYVSSFILSVVCTPRLSFRFRVVIVRGRGWALWDIVYVFWNLQNDHLTFSHDRFALAWWVSARGGSYSVWARPRNKPVQAWQHCQISNCLSVNKSCDWFAEGTPFAGGVFKLRLSLDGDYPMTPPKGEPSSVKSLMIIIFSCCCVWINYKKLDAFVSLPMAGQWLCIVKGMSAADSWVELTCAAPCQCEANLKEECICCSSVPHQASQTWTFPPSHRPFIFKLYFLQVTFSQRSSIQISPRLARFASMCLRRTGSKT